MKKYLLLGLVLFACLATLSSCKLVVRPLEGTWTVTSLEVTSGARVLGNGTITLSFLSEVPGLGWEAYSGSGTFTGGVFVYNAEGLYIPGFGVTIELSETGEVDPNKISLDDNTFAGGSTLIGTYAGTGVYGSLQTKDIGAGTFTATK